MNEEASAANAYHFITDWRFEATREEIVDILSNAPDLVRWWPAVYLAITQVRSGDANGVGSAFDLHTQGWLPYTLRWTLSVTESRGLDGFTIGADGDFVGRGIWTFTQDGPWVDVRYDWRIRADKTLLRLFSPIAKPIFSANHHWAMRRGEESLRLELARRRATTDAERAAVPPPPAPVRWPIGAIVGGLGGLLAVLALRRRRGR